MQTRLYGRTANALLRGVALLLALSASLAVEVDRAAAAPPIGGARYYGFNGRLGDFSSALPSSSPHSAFRQLTGKLHVSRSGRRLRNRSYVLFGFDCKRDKDAFVDGRLDLASRRLRGPRIRRDGSFRAVRRRGRLRYRLRGRFVSPNAVQVVYRVSIPPLRPKNRADPGRCRSPRTRVALRKNGDPPFSGCRQQHARTLIWGPAGRLFIQYRYTRYNPAWYDDASTFNSFYPFVFGCLFHTNKRFGLSQDTNEGPDFDPQAMPWWRWPPVFVDQLRLAGPYTTWATDTVFTSGLAGDDMAREIVVLDLSSGARRVIGRPDVSSDPDQRDDADVEDLALKENGSVAWIVSGAALTEQGARDYVEVWALDGRGRRRLDSGSGISRHSLSLQGSTLRWVEDGTVRAATLY